jgi:hypothetical protein
MRPEFEPFPSLKRLYREIVVTEKLDGTNAQVCITEDGEVFAGSRNRWITVEDDNYGFARFVEDNKEEFLKLGVGRHFGEWWGNGIQRGYNKQEKTFSLFNTGRWRFNTKSVIKTVPILYEGMFSDEAITDVLSVLNLNGSRASPGFMNPEGIVVFHTHSRQSFKVTLDNNDQHKWEALNNQPR